MVPAVTRTRESTGVAGEQFVAQTFTTQTSQQINISRMFNFDVDAYRDQANTEYCERRVWLSATEACLFTDPSGANGMTWLLPDESAMFVITTDVSESDIVEIASAIEAYDEG